MKTVNDIRTSLLKLDLLWHIGKAEGINIRPAKGSSLIGQEQGQLPQADTVTDIHITNCHHLLRSIKEQPKKKHQFYI